MKGFLKLFSDSARELKSLRCLTVTAMLIALAVVLKSLLIPIGDTLKISFSYLSLASIGMLFGPVVGGLSGIATDIIGYLVKPTGAFSPIFTVVEATAGVIYGIFLYKLAPVSVDFKALISGDGSLFSKLVTVFVKFFRIIVTKFTVNLVCNVFMNTAALVLSGYIAREVLWVKVGERALKNLAMLPIEVILLCMVLFPVLETYKAVFRKRATSQ